MSKMPLSLRQRLLVAAIVVLSPLLMVASSMQPASASVGIGARFSTSEIQALHTLAGGAAVSTAGGTTNTVPKWTNGAGRAVGDSTITDDGTIVTVNTGSTFTTTLATLANATITTTAKNTLLALTPATMTAEKVGEYRSSLSSYTWSNAQVVALGGVGAGDISVATLPAKTVVRNAYVVILTPDSSANALTVACGRVSATYIDYIVASDAKAASNTVYGDASGERGTNLTGYDLPSYTATTTVNCHFIKTTTNLSTVTGSTGRVILETTLVP